MSDKHDARDNAAQKRQLEAADVWFEIDSKIWKSVASEFGFDEPNVPVEQQYQYKKLYEFAFSAGEHVQDASAALFSVVLGERASKRHIGNLQKEADFAKLLGHPQVSLHYLERALKFSAKTQGANSAETKRLLGEFELTDNRK